MNVTTYYGVDLTDNIESEWKLPLDNGNKGSFHLFGEVLNEISSSITCEYPFVIYKDTRNVIEGIFFAKEMEVDEHGSSLRTRFLESRTDEKLDNIFNEMNKEIINLYGIDRSAKILDKSLSVNGPSEFIEKFSILRKWIKNGNMEYIHIVENFS